MGVATPVRRLSWWSKEYEAVLDQWGKRAKWMVVGCRLEADPTELADGLGEEIGISMIPGFGLSNWVDSSAID